MASGGLRVSITRIWPFEVCVRRSRPPGRKKVSCISRAGWSGGKLSAPKLWKSSLDILRRDDFETHRGEDIEHPFEALRHRMEPSARDAHAGEGDIDARFAERTLHLGALHFFTESRDAALKFGFDLVDETPNYRTLFGGHLAHPAHDLGQF